MYAQARRVFESERYPPNVAYAIHVAAYENGTRTSADYGAVYRGATDIVRVNPFSAQEVAAPHVARGTNLQFKISVSMGETATIFRRQLNQGERPTDILGVPQLAPNYSFGIARRAPMSERSSTPPAPDARLAVIGTVSSRQRAYRIEYAGRELAGNDVAAHLRLEPINDPERNRLREMWLDPASCIPLKLRVSSNFSRAPWAPVPWTITYQQVAGTTYLASEIADAPLRTRGHTYDSVTISFEGIASRDITAIEELNLNFSSKTPQNTLQEP